MARPADWLRTALRKVAPPQPATSAAGATLLLACFVGVCAALVALTVKWLIERLHSDLFLGAGQPARMLPLTWRYALTLVPPCAFLISAYVIRRWVPEAAGSGIDRVMSAVGHRAGYIRARVIVLKSALSVLCIGAGAPLGMEGPVVHSGAAIGSLLGRRLRLSVPNIRVLVAAGAAAALAAKYGTPVGGAVFSAELILGNVSAEALLPVLVAAFLAVTTRHIVRTDVAEYVVSFSYSFAPIDYALLAPLGVLCGVAAAWFIKTVFAVGDLMDTLFSRWWLKAVCGGLVISLVGFWEPNLLGMGNHVVQNLLNGQSLAFGVLVVFLVGKPLLCSVALGSGTSGGVFAPALFAGAALGALFSRGLVPLELTAAPSGVFVIIGMAALMGAVMRAPLQAILIGFELTHSYYMVPALMLACVLSFHVSRFLEPESVFTRRLVRAGERLSHGMDFALLDGMRVSDIMDPNAVALPVSAGIGSLTAVLRESENTTFPVADAEGRLVGIVTLSRLVAAAEPARKAPGSILVRDLMEPHVLCLHPEDPLLSAWQVMGHYDYDCLPVCSSEEEGHRIVGVCEKEAIVELHDRQSFVAMLRER
jgi:CIC family chloride channel protein